MVDSPGRGFVLPRGWIVAYRKLEVRVWYDEKFSQLNPTEKLIFLYILQGPQTNRIGYFCFSVGECAECLGLTGEGVREGVRGVCQTLSWHFDQTHRVILLPHWFKYNQPGSKDTLKGYLKDFDNLPNTPLYPLFYRAIKQYAPSGLEYLGDPPPQGLGEGVGDPPPHQEQEQEQEQELELEQELNKPPPPPSPEMSATPMGVVVEDVWKLAASELRSVGVADLSCLDDAHQNGVPADLVRELIRQAAQQPHLGAGALVYRIRNATRDDEPTKGWPPKPAEPPKPRKKIPSFEVWRALRIKSMNGVEVDHDLELKLRTEFETAMRNGSSG